MICPVCGSIVPDNAVVCVRCVLEHNRRPLRHFQYHPLREVSQGRAKFTTRTINGVRHIQMFGAELTFCNIAIAPQHRRGWLESATPQTKDEALRLMSDLKQICAFCRQQVIELLDEAVKCSA